MSDAKERVFVFASDCFMSRVESLLDDPHGMIGDEPHETFFATLRQLARDLEMNLDLLIDQLGTKFEATRLRELMHRN